MNRLFSYLLLIMLLGSCIGEDIVDDELISAELVITPQQMAFRIGESLQLAFTFTNEFGQQVDAPIVWTSSDESIVTVDASGLATALAPGQASVTAITGSTQSNVALLTVVPDDDAVASVSILSESLTLQVDETTTLQVEVRDVVGNIIANPVVSWSSSNPAVATVDAAGMVAAVTEGEAEITATVQGVESTPVAVAVGDSQRTATFSGASGYTAQGTALLEINDQNQLILELSDDFNTDFALGTFIYLSNSTNGANTRNNGLELGELTRDGAATFNVSNIDGSVTLSEYRYVIVLCKPASITFGVADFEE